MYENPRIYDATLDVFFSDLDSYGHVNASRYLDYVISSRWKFGQQHLDYSAESLAEHGLGSFIARASLEFKQPIEGMQTIRVRSHIARVKLGILFLVKFEITTPDLSTLFARGDFEFSAIDLATKRPTRMPDWTMGYFFEPEPTSSSSRRNSSPA